MTRIALFGGSFNPPHVAHQLAALYVLETQPIDELWIVPTFAHPFGKDLAPYEDRVAMCTLAARALGPRVLVSRAEQELAARPGFVASRTLDLIEDLQGKHPTSTFRLVIGTDILGETGKWHRWNDVVARAPLIVVGRSGHARAPGSGETGLVMPQVSATRVRELLAAADYGQIASGAGPDALRALVPAQVLLYIAGHGLYR